LEARVAAMCRDEGSTEDVAKWIDASLRSYGEDARGLVAEAIHAFVASERNNIAVAGDDRRRNRLQCLDAIAEFFPKPRPSDL
jgi:hypothetical protein